MFNTSKLHFRNIVQKGKDLWLELMNDDTNTDSIVTFQEYIMLIIQDMDWLYMSISLYNELKSVCLTCKGIVCGVRVDICNAMLQFVAPRNNKRTRYDINVFPADGVLLS